MTNITIQDFHHDIAAAEEASKQGPVLITEEGKPKHVLLDVAEYWRLATERAAAAKEAFDPSLPTSALLALPEGQSFDWEPEGFHFNFPEADLY